MPISLILTPFDHFHFRLALAVKCIPDLRVRLKQSWQTSYLLPAVLVSKFSGWCQNIARGTTDPEIDSVTWIKHGTPLALVATLATRWRHLH